MTTLPTTSEWLRANATAPLIGVDREAGEAGIIHGVVLAQEGPFKTPGRGEFDRKSLKQIVAVAKAAPGGLKSRFSHPDESGDGIGKLVGWMKVPRLDTVTTRERDGKQLTDPIQAVRADLHISKMAILPPPEGGGTPYGEYVMGLAEENPSAFSTSLVVGEAGLTEEYRIEKNGVRKRDEEGNELPPLWRIEELHASDIVDTGDAVDDFLSAGLDTGNLPNRVLWQAAHLLDAQFADQPRDAVEARCRAWLDRYLSNRFGEAQNLEPLDSARLQRLMVDPGLFIALCQGAEGNPLPAGAEVVDTSYDLDHDAVVMTFRSDEWEPVAPGSVVPILNAPVLGDGFVALRQGDEPYDPNRDPDRLDRERRLEEDDGTA